MPNNVVINGGGNKIVIEIGVKKLIIALSVFFIVGATFFLYPKGDYSNESLYEDYFEKPKIILRDNVEAQTGAFVLAVESMKTKHYQDAIHKFDHIITKQALYHEKAMWYKGLCLLKTNANDEVIFKHFSKLFCMRGEFSSSALEILSKKDKESRNNNTHQYY